MTILDGESKIAKAFAMHWFQLGTGGHSTLYLFQAAHMVEIRNELRRGLVFPAVALNGPDQKGTHVILFVADRDEKIVVYYDINAEDYDAEGNY